MSRSTKQRYQQRRALKLVNAELEHKRQEAAKMDANKMQRHHHGLAVGGFFLALVLSTSIHRPPCAAPAPSSPAAATASFEPADAGVELELERAAK